jgi:hypothetical protein
VNAAKGKQINLSSFLEAKLFELFNSESNQCGGREFITNLLVKITQLSDNSVYFIFLNINMWLFTV